MSRFQKDVLKIIIRESFSLRQVLKKLNIIPAGGNYQTLKKYIKKFNLDTSHFKGQGWKKDQAFKPKRPIEVYLDNEIYIQSYKLKIRLLKEEILDAICNKCKGTEWLGKPIPLELEHKDGNNKNNNLENLELLCPNCHAFTSTYRGKKFRKVKTKNKTKNFSSCKCGSKISKNSKECIRCSHKKQQKIDWPDTQKLMLMIKNSNYEAVARCLGVSSNSIRKRIKNHPF